MSMALVRKRNNT